MVEQSSVFLWRFKPKLLHEKLYENRPFLQ